MLIPLCLTGRVTLHPTFIIHLIIIKYDNFKQLDPVSNNPGGNFIIKERFTVFRERLCLSLLASRGILLFVIFSRLLVFRAT